jgi:hypothetical protein
MSKQRTSMTLSQQALKLMQILSKKLGLSKASVVELAIRKLAEQENISLPENHDQGSQEI